MSSESAGSKKPKAKKANHKLTIESQVNSVMSLPEPEDETNKSKKAKPTPSKNKSLSRILKYCYHEPIIDIKFIGRIITLYTQSLFQKTLNKSLYAGINPVKSIRPNARRSRMKNFIPEERKQYISLAVEKVYNLLLANNTPRLEKIKEYKSQYQKNKSLH